MGEDWGSNDAFLNHHKWSPDEFVIGAGNHDPQPLRQIANGVPDVCNFNNVHKNKNINPLARILNIPADVLNNPVEFAKAKFAEITTAKIICFSLWMFSAAKKDLISIHVNQVEVLLKISDIKYRQITKRLSKIL